MDSSGCIYQLRLAQIAKQHCDFDQLLWDLRARNATGSIRERWIGASWIIELVSSASRLIRCRGILGIWRWGEEGICWWGEGHSIDRLARG
jgi:hypothetical protein